MFLTNLFNLKKVCTHEKITPNMEAGYCPDCGKYIQNEWYITRCACCGIKLKTIARKEKIQPQEHYCANCGSAEYTVIKLPSINFVDINFAVLIKRFVEEEKKASFTQCWQEKNSVQPKLLTRYL